MGSVISHQTACAASGIVSVLLCRATVDSNYHLQSYTEYSNPALPKGSFFVAQRHKRK